MLTAHILEHAPHAARPNDVILWCKNLSRFLGEDTVYDLTKKRLQDYADHRRDEYKDYQIKRYGRATRTLSDGTIRRELEELKSALRKDKDEKRLSEVPTIWMPKKPAPRDRWLTHREVASLIKEAEKLERARAYLPLYILMSVYTVARKEAVLTRRWVDVDFEKDIINNGEGNDIKRRTKVPIPKRLKRELLEARKRGTEMGYIIHNNQEPIKDIKKGFRRARINAGLGPEVTPHILRHTGISWMVQRDINLNKVAKWAGASVKMIENVYGHLSPSYLDEIKEGYG